MPVVRLPGAKVRVAAGGFGEAVSPLRPPTEVTLLDVSLDDGAELKVPLAAGHGAIVMPIHGALSVDGRSFERDDLRLPVLQPESSARVMLLRTPRGTAKATIFAGVPLYPSAI